MPAGQNLECLVQPCRPCPGERWLGSGRLGFVCSGWWGTLPVISWWLGYQAGDLSSAGPPCEDGAGHDPTGPEAEESE